MSYDFTMEMDTGGSEPAVVCDIGNYTYNVGGMFALALEESIWNLSGLPGNVLANRFDEAVKHMEANPETYAAMNPSNGWGDADGAAEMLKKMAQACRDHPKALFAVR